MDLAEYETYKAQTTPEAHPHVHISEVPGPDRTLVYGYSRAYDAEFNESTHTVHVYKRDGALHVVFYRGMTGERVASFSGASVPVEECVPQKRAYPERTDAAFAHLLRAKGNPLCFTTFDESCHDATASFHGMFVEDTHEPAVAAR